MKNILIVEDDMIIAFSHKIMLEDLGYKVAGIASNIEKINVIAESQSIDLALVDINLGLKVTGISVAKYLSELHIPYLFVTSYIDRETIDNALETHPVGYIVKPLNPTILYTQLEMAFQKIDQNYIHLKDAGKNYFFDTRQISYIQAEGNYCTIYNSGFKTLIRTSLKKLIALLPANYVQPHKAYIVNPLFITAVRDNELILADKKTISITRHYKESLLSKLKSVK